MIAGERSLTAACRGCGKVLRAVPGEFRLHADEGGLLVMWACAGCWFGWCRVPRHLVRLVAESGVPVSGAAAEWLVRWRHPSGRLTS